MALGTSKWWGLLGTFASQRATRHITLVVVQVVLLVVLMSSITHWCKKEGRELLQHLRHAEVLGVGREEAAKTASSLEPPRFSITATDAQKARLEELRKETRGRARFHLQTMVFLFANYYTAVMMFSITGALATISLVLISKKGWNEANEYIVTVFFVMTASTVFFGALPSLFRQDETIAQNKQLYLKYVALEDEILTYAATGLHSPVSEQVPAQERGAGGASLAPDAAVGGSGALAPRAHREPAPGEFILYVDRELARDTIPIGMDYSKAPTYKGAFELQPGR